MYVRHRSHSGVTLVELIVFIVIVSVGLAGVLSSLNVSVRGSADPFAYKQALAVAESLLEEVLLKNYSDPDGSNNGETRQTFDNVTDFDTPDDGSGTSYSTDLVGNAWPSIVTNASVAISSTTLGSTSVNAWQVTVTITYTGGNTLTLTGYRANY